MRTLLCTAAALAAFAANSVLCRPALAGGLIDAPGFATIRLAAGAALLWAWLRLAPGGAARAPDRGGRTPRRRSSWISAAALAAYAVAFTFAYLDLTAGTGALVLFGAVQATMLLAALRAGERPGAAERLGLASALAGLVVLLRPGLSAPPVGGAVLMAAAGAAWGLYSLRGRASTAPLADTAHHFLRALPLAAAAGLAVIVARTIDPDAVAPAGAGGVHATGTGVLLAVLSGAVASGAGYVAWYAALRRLTATRAAIVQLAVPLLAALGGVAFLDERVTLRLAVAAALILGGVALAVTGRSGRTARAAAAPDPVRYSSLPLPARRHVPGRGPHPGRSGVRDPARRLPPVRAPLGEDSWRDAARYLHAVDLFNRRYWWETHAALEGFWLAAGRESREGRLLQGIILVAAAFLKRDQGRAAAAARLGRRGIERLRSLPDPCLGVAVAALARATEASLFAGRRPPPIIRLADRET